MEEFHRYGVQLPYSPLMQFFSWLSGLCYYEDDMEEYRRSIFNVKSGRGRYDVRKKMGIVFTDFRFLMG